MTQEKREIPTKTIVIISVLIVLGIISYMLNEMGKAGKAAFVLNKVGYSNIKSLSVARIIKFRNDDTGIEGYKYTVRFTNLDNKKDCRGFIWADFKNNILQDIECK